MYRSWLDGLNDLVFSNGKWKRIYFIREWLGYLRRADLKLFYSDWQLKLHVVSIKSILVFPFHFFSMDDRMDLAEHLSHNAHVDTHDPQVMVTRKYIVNPDFIDKK